MDVDGKLKRVPGKLNVKRFSAFVNVDGIKVNAVNPKLYKPRSLSIEIMQKMSCRKRRSTKKRNVAEDDIKYDIELKHKNCPPPKNPVLKKSASSILPRSNFGKIHFFEKRLSAYENSHQNKAQNISKNNQQQKKPKKRSKHYNSNDPQLIYIASRKITIIGDSRVGKTSLKNAINGKAFQEMTFCTVRASTLPTIHREFISSNKSAMESFRKQNSTRNEISSIISKHRETVIHNEYYKNDCSSDTNLNGKQLATDLSVIDDDSKAGVEDDAIGIDYEMWDTPGQIVLQYIPPLYITGAFAVFIVYDITDEHSFKRAKYWVTYLKDNCKGYENVILIGNKCDLKDEREVNIRDAQVYARDNGLYFIELSVKTKMNYDMLMEWLNHMSVENEEFEESDCIRLHDLSENQKNRSSNNCCWSI